MEYIILQKTDFENNHPDDTITWQTFIDMFNLSDDTTEIAMDCTLVSHNNEEM